MSSAPESLALPSRFELLHPLGSGGGGDMWAARDRPMGRVVAIKTLREQHGAAEAEALVRETTILSGLEGLGFPRVLELGRSPDGRLYLIREMVEGQSLENVVQREPRRALSLLPLVGDVLTVVHRAGFVHGDVKPGNVIVRSDGEVALVDLGLASALRSGPGRALGFTPHYAAPELLEGAAATPATEVFALGVMLRDLMMAGADEALHAAHSERLHALADRATAHDPSARFPSTDEFSEALRGALSGDAAARLRPGIPWPVLGLESTAYELEKQIVELTPGSELRVGGAPGAGCSTLLRRVAWHQALLGRHVLRLELDVLEAGWGAEEIAQLGHGDLLILDGSVGGLSCVTASARARGVTLILATDLEQAQFVVPPLDDHRLVQLVRGALPGLSERLARSVLDLVGRAPGRLRRFVDEAGSQPLANAEDIRRILGGTVLAEGEAHEVVARCLEQGHFQAAAKRVGELDLGGWLGQWLTARFEIGAGSAQRALELCLQAEEQVPPGEQQQALQATRARAHLGLGQYAETLALVDNCDAWAPAPRAEALAYRGLSLTFLARPEEALQALKQGHEVARDSGRGRLVALLASSLATAQWRAGQSASAEASYQEAIEAARAAGDAGILASSQINLSGLMKERGDLASSIELLEGAVDSARRAGRESSVHQALLNLSNSDLYLGRLERARLQIAQVGDPDQLPAALRAQCLGLVAELKARDEDLEAALEEYRACAQAWEALGRFADAAEALLEACVFAASAAPAEDSGPRRFVPSLAVLEGLLAEGERLLNGEPSALLLLARAQTAHFAGRDAAAEEFAEAAAEVAEKRGKREWQWRAFELLARLYESAGKRTRAQKMTERALEVLEEIGARLPQDLREVFWSDSRRGAIRSARAADGWGSRAPLSSQELTTAGPGYAALSGVDAVSRMTMTPLERRLARVLAINSDLAAEVDLERLATKIIAHACELLAAERGYLLLGSDAERLRIVATRGGQGASHQDFSRSVAREVLATGRPLVSVDTGRDRRLQAFESVHLSAVSAVACVPILSPHGAVIGAIYVETRTGARPSFGDEVPTLQAFADQAAIALENARLLAELKKKSTALERKNEHLREARERLKEALGKRTTRLWEVRRELRQTKSQLASHASYGQMVGQSPQMRRIYALIDRIRDTDVPVLITGESGTGKEVVARSIFEGSTRAKGRMLALNCGAVPEAILESELFGHTRGAFTGADRDRLGLFREADGGVLFLDEVGEMPLKMQASLLRALQERKVRPVGGSVEVSVDARVIFATNRDLQAAVETGAFREDLLYRIQVVEVALPPLRDRTEDIPLLCDHFLQRFAIRFGQEKKTLHRAAMKRLLEYPFPGNIRQLENILLNAWVMCEGDVLTVEDLRLDPTRLSPRRLEASRSIGDEALTSSSVRPLSGGSPRSALDNASKASKQQALSERELSERERIIEALEQTGWNRFKAAQLLDIPRRTFYRRLKVYGIQ